MYTYEKITTENKAKALAIYFQNTAYFALTDESPTSESLENDLKMLPDSDHKVKKVYRLITDAQKAIGVMDLLLNYPEAHQVHLGLLLIGEKNKGHGRKVYQEVAQQLVEAGYTQIQLGVLQKNGQAFKFWTELDFVKFKETTVMINQKEAKITMMRQELSY
ncbi:GNAT family N-acetyltransferase [Isobaculum melis]|uniref:Acetyltransferase (GNAT) family protein n=1 Tax=Isobaculum melis TaxID=142588 RepID=A0A1H9PS51_9LACT|nr:GNAT family N-acetyltransferase [Isobaculum melis]SER50938.1 hypothetical protein SAMN04488559_10197 [Isobaculum melis]